MNKYKNFISGIASQVANAIYGIVIPAYIIRIYGSTLNGLTSSISQFTAYLSLVESGIVSASLVALYGPLAYHDEEKINDIMFEIKKFYGKIAIVFALLSVGISFIFPIFISDNVPYFLVFAMFLTIAASNLVTYLVSGKYKSLLQADNRIYVVNIIHTIEIVLQTVLTALCLMYNLNIIYTKVAVVISMCIEGYILYHYCISNYKFLNLKSEHKNLHALKQQKDIIVHQVSALITNNTDTFLLMTIGHSLALVSVYSVYNMILSIISTICNIMMSSVSAIIGQLVAKKQFNEVKSKIMNFELIYDVALFTLWGCYAVLIMPFVRFYTKGITDANYNIVSLGILFTLMGLTTVIELPYSQLIGASGHFKETKKFAVIKAIINLSTSIVLLLFLGIQGVIIGTIISNIYDIFTAYFYINKNIISFNWKISIYRLVRNFCTAILVLLMFKSKILFYTPSSILDFVMLGVFVLLVFFVLLLVINLVFERDNMIMLLGKMKNRIFR